MDTNLDIKSPEELQKVAQNIGGVAFSDGQELGEAVKEVVPPKNGIFAKIKRLFKKYSLPESNK
jgi:hypothetical protein